MFAPARRTQHSTGLCPPSADIDHLEEDFLGALQTIALLPIRRASLWEAVEEVERGDRQAAPSGNVAPGILRPDGPDAWVIRRCALAWVAQASPDRYPADELAGLAVALDDMTDDDIAGWVRGFDGLNPAPLV